MRGDPRLRRGADERIARQDAWSEGGEQTDGQGSRGGDVEACGRVGEVVGGVDVCCGEGFGEGVRAVGW